MCCLGKPERNERRKTVVLRSFFTIRPLSLFYYYRSTFDILPTGRLLRKFHS
jgi:hypothetical protein